MCIRDRLMKGAPTLLTVFLVCAYITVVTMVILGGVCRKTVCAALGTVAGMALALLFGLLSQSLLRIDGLRLTDVEPLLQLRQTGTPLSLRGLLVAGVVISALGAVMDVAMSISSALTEVHTVAPDRDGRALFRSGMNIGRDMVGTMTNTLILAFLGSGLSFIIYLYSLGLDPRQLISSPYMATEVISGIASSIGHMLGKLFTSPALGTLLLTGGDTLLQCMNCVGIKELEPVCEMEKGVVLARFTYCGCTRYVITKSGGFGHEKLLLDLADRIAAE